MHMRYEYKNRLIAAVFYKKNNCANCVFDKETCIIECFDTTQVECNGESCRFEFVDETFDDVKYIMRNDILFQLCNNNEHNPCFVCSLVDDCNEINHECVYNWHFVRSSKEVVDV